jgi:hypothetical protein
VASIFLVSCASTKRAEPSAAKDLYTSQLFEKSREYAGREADRWYILSAKHGLLSPAKEIAPYNVTLKGMSKSERLSWAAKTAAAISQVTTPNDSITILAGEAYREFLIPELHRIGYSVQVPMQGLSIGNQLKWLTERLWEYRSHSDADRLYGMLHRLEVGLEGKRTLGASQGKAGWPHRGIYFFFEPGEHRKASDTPRVVRVGTHAVSKGSVSSLWGRLRSHRGIPKGGGNHRGSIFRLHVGAAMLHKFGWQCGSWGIGQTASAEIKQCEHWLELKVSEYICSMPFLWLAVGDTPSNMSDRAYLERNTIALLSHREAPIDPPGPEWLGHWSPRPSIRNSGLWNVRHIDEQYDPRFLEIFEQYVAVTLGEKPVPKRSLAPKRRLRDKHQKSMQMRLFSKS